MHHAIENQRIVATQRRALEPLIGLQMPIEATKPVDDEMARKLSIEQIEEMKRMNEKLDKLDYSEADRGKGKLRVFTRRMITDKNRTVLRPPPRHCCPLFFSN